MKLSIVYDSKTGSTAKMAEYIAEGIRTVPGAEAKTFPITAVDEDYVKASSALIVGTPTYNGSLTARMKAWLEDAPAKLDVAGKLGGALCHCRLYPRRRRSGHPVRADPSDGGRHDGLFRRSGMGHAVIHLGPVAIGPDLEGFGGAVSHLRSAHARRQPTWNA